MINAPHGTPLTEASFSCFAPNGNGKQSALSRNDTMSLCRSRADMLSAMDAGVNVASSRARFATRTSSRAACTDILRFEFESVPPKGSPVVNTQ